MAPFKYNEAMDKTMIHLTQFLQKRRWNIVLSFLLIAMTSIALTLNSKLETMQNSIDRVNKMLSQKDAKMQSFEAKVQEQNRTLQVLLSEKAKAEAYIEKLSKELEGATTLFPLSNESNATKSKEGNNTRGIRGYYQSIHKPWS
jgi:septal ring factor EnvC (AmiA/AmiB activator)